MHGKELSADHCGQSQCIEHLDAVVPHVHCPKLTEALVIEAVDLKDEKSDRA
jgi:hypothetical protein